MKISRSLKIRLKRTGMAFLRRIRHRPDTRFKANYYYVCMGQVVASLQGHPTWKQGYRAAKRLHRSAFIMRGATLNRKLDAAQWTGHKQIWRGYAAR